MTDALSHHATLQESFVDGSWLQVIVAKYDDLFSEGIFYILTAKTTRSDSRLIDVSEWFRVAGKSFK